MSKIELMALFSISIKVMAAVIGAIVALMLAGDIDTEGRIKINSGMVIRFSCAVAISIYGGGWFIETYHLQAMTATSQGFVYLLMAVFGLLIVGICYQAIAMLKGKPLHEITSEIIRVLISIFIKK